MLQDSLAYILGLDSFSGTMNAALLDSFWHEARTRSNVCHASQLGGH